MVVQCILMMCVCLASEPSADVRPDHIAVQTPAKVSCAINGSVAYARRPITAIISIIHERQQKIDVASFSQNDKPFPVQFVEEVVVPAATLFAPDDPQGLIVTKYSFVIPPKEPGDYVIDPIHVTVGNCTVFSPITTFSVTTPQTSDTLRLEARIIETPPYYPGQTLHFEYRIYFKEAIELVAENYALFSFPGFLTRGAPHIETFSLGGESVQSITQEVIAPLQGTYSSGRSVIEGFATKKTATGKIERILPLLHAEAMPISLTILPFPDMGKPESFFGAIGDFTWELRSLSNTTLGLSDTISLQLQVKGRGDFNSVSLPQLNKIQGFKQNFLFDPMNARAEEKAGVKTITFSLKPQHTGKLTLPAIEVSSFDPTQKRYVKATLSAFSFTVQEDSVPSKKREKEKGIQLLEYEGVVVLKETELYRKELALLWIIGFHLMLGIIFAAEVMLRRYHITHKKTPKTSRKLMLEVIQNKGDTSFVLQNISKALLLHLYEVGVTKELMQYPKDLKEEGVEGDVKRFLLSIEKTRFSGDSAVVTVDPYIEEATKLYAILKPIKTGHVGILKTILFSTVLFCSSSVCGAEFVDTGFGTFVQAEKSEKAAQNGKVNTAKMYNEALSFYLSKTEKNPSGLLCYNIGNCYLKLGEYGGAIYYYYRALDDMPRNTMVMHNLRLACKEAGLSGVEARNFGFLGFPYYYFSEFEVRLFIMAFAGALFVFASFYLWSQIRFFRVLRNICFVVLGMLILSLFWRNYLAHNEGVLLKSRALYAAPSSASVPLLSKPLFAGTKVTIIRLEKNGWYFVQLPSGLEGYLPPSGVEPL